MSNTFTNNDIEKISEILGQAPENEADFYLWNISTGGSDNNLVVSLHNKVSFGESFGAIVSIQTTHGYYELHDVLQFLVFEPDEVIFYNDSGKTVSCLVVSKSGACSLYSNISKSLLREDMSLLDPACLLAAMQLSILESKL